MFLEYHNGTSWIQQTTGTVTSISATGSTGLTVGGSPITSSGTLSFTLATILQSFSSLATTGLVINNAGTISGVTITGTAGNITVSNGTGAAGNPTINLATVGTPVTGFFGQITTDSFGRVTSTGAATSANITNALGYTPVNNAGDTMSGILNMGGFTIQNAGSPVNGTDVANKNYVDAATTGLSWKNAVAAATTAADGNQSLTGAATVDGYTVVTNDRILIKNQTTASANGIYIANTGGAWTRASDADSAAELSGAAVYVMRGSTQADTGWTQISDNITLGTTSLVWTQFAGSNTYTAGTGLTLTGNTFSITAPISVSLGGTGLTAAPTNGQLLIGNGSTYTLSTLTAGTAVSVTNAAGSITIANTGVTSNVAGTGISVSSGTGAVTITNTGVTSLIAGTGISVSSATGAVTVNNTGVTSVALSLPSIFTVSGSPVTATGTLTGTLASQSANTIFAAPNGSAGTPAFRSLAYADLPLRLYVENPSTPTAPTAVGANAVAIGSGSTAPSALGIALGSGSAANVYGMQAFANGSFASAGDAQDIKLILRNITTNAASTELFLDGAAGTQRFVLPNNSAVSFRITITARRTDAVGGSAGYVFEGNMRKDTTAGSVTFTGTPSKSVLGETNVGWDAAISADTVNGSLKITVNGEGSKTIRWVAVIDTVVVTN